ncbi:3-beta-hydroxysteroid-Delta(8),Delta(7)-isomerase-like [Mercenaria mercenaria]|uniref:3-beta-hydroxysteroid-Delta(8), Delta(7)-isomerase-like n=1 Tax=Mercenaria mercenaria TaxID=6596 RepID=UPI001E1E0CCB|nr:3-beta-hydroxysteroid-Delta(8),Delta(7)-isomerase-like [Mercenaria mercenaria]
MSTDAVKHPYFPRDTYLPHYKPNINTISELLGLFFGLVAVLIVILWLSTKRKSTGVRIKICWFVSCGFIHTILEGYFGVYHATLAGEQTFLAQMWKEYGKGDSRYISGDVCMVAMESITAFVDGPLCFLTAAAFMFQQGARYRFVLQLAVSICQLYGDTLYFSTEILEGFKHSEMWHPLHFWFYFFFLNILWIIIPSINILDAFISLCRAQETADKANPQKRNKTKKVK